MKKTQKNYRKIYSDYYGVEIPKGFHIHHIDGNRENNHPHNLLAIPEYVHQRYHIALTQLQPCILNGGLIDFNYYLYEESIENLYNATKDMYFWMWQRLRSERKQALKDPNFVGNVKFN